MPWKKSDLLIGTQLRRHGLTNAIIAGTVCQHADSLYPGLFKATSLVDGVLRVSTTIEKQLAFRQIEGKLLQQLKAYAEPKNLRFQPVYD